MSLTVWRCRPKSTATALTAATSQFVDEGGQDTGDTRATHVGKVQSFGLNPVIGTVDAVTLEADESLVLPKHQVAQLLGAMVIAVTERPQLPQV